MSLDSRSSASRVVAINFSQGQALDFGSTDLHHDVGIVAVSFELVLGRCGVHEFVDLLI